MQRNGQHDKYMYCCTRAGSFAHRYRMSAIDLPCCGVHECIESLVQAYVPPGSSDMWAWSHCMRSWHSKPQYALVCADAFGTRAFVNDTWSEHSAPFSVPTPARNSLSVYVLHASVQPCRVWQPLTLEAESSSSCRTKETDSSYPDPVYPIDRRQGQAVKGPIRLADRRMLDSLHQ